MRKLFVKICGITRPQDAPLAADLGASAIGFVFWPGSPRYISPEAAREIVRLNASRVKTVGVFVDESVEYVTQVMDEVGHAAQPMGRSGGALSRLMVRLTPRLRRWRPGHRCDQGHRPAGQRPGDVDRV